MKLKEGFFVGLIIAVLTFLILTNVPPVTKVFVRFLVRDCLAQYGHNAHCLQDWYFISLFFGFILALIVGAVGFIVVVVIGSLLEKKDEPLLEKKDEPLDTRQKYYRRYQEERKRKNEAEEDSS